MKVKKLTEDAIIPTRGTPGSAGLDLYASEDAVIEHFSEWAMIGTGISVAIPEGCVGMIRPRSGLAVNHGIDVLAGVIDSDFRQELKVILINHGENEYYVKKGDRIAQLVIHQVDMSDPVEVQDLDQTDRKGGFGSSGR